MIGRLIVALLVLFALIATLMVGADVLNVGTIETLIAVCLITGFTVVAVVWRIGRESMRC